LKQSTRFTLGYAVSVIYGALFLSILVANTASKGQGEGESQALALLHGIADSLIYTTLFIVNRPLMIAVWLAFKLLLQSKLLNVHVPKNFPVVLRATSVLLILAYVGAWIALWRMPLM
jgi:hypothetical protein